VRPELCDHGKIPFMPNRGKKWLFKIFCKGKMVAGRADVWHLKSCVLIEKKMPFKTVMQMKNI